jgi:hypothetical protein
LASCTRTKRRGNSAILKLGPDATLFVFSFSVFFALFLLDRVITVCFGPGMDFRQTTKVPSGLIPFAVKGVVRKNLFRLQRLLKSLETLPLLSNSSPPSHPRLSEEKDQEVRRNSSDAVASTDCRTLRYDGMEQVLILSRTVQVGGLVVPGSVVFKGVVQTNQNTFFGEYESLYRRTDAIRDEQPLQPASPLSVIDFVWNHPVSGKLVKSVDVGSTVSAGTVLIEVDCQPLYQRLALLQEADLALASSSQTGLNDAYQERLSRFVLYATSGRRDEVMLRS